MNEDQLIECIPNFSEGRDQAVIDSIAFSIESVPGVKILHIDMGFDAHRTVITYAGNPEACKEAAYRSICTARELIDMRKHHGAHPRIGAIDVFPFVPLQHITMQETIDITHTLGRRIGAELQMPVYMYNESAKRSYRKNLADIRTGEYEGLADKLNSPEGQPDFGPNLMNEKSGAIILGARKILVAFNINLKTEDIRIAKKIANRLREKKGGLKAVRAIGWYMPEYKCVQVSTNLVDIDVTPLHQVFEACKMIAHELNVEVNGSELVGLIPLRCLIEAAEFYSSEKIEDETSKINIAAVYLGLNAVKVFDSKSQIIEFALNK